MGTRKDEKGKRFEFLISRIDEAIEEGYYVEALSITYALFEERTYQLLDRLNITYRNDDKLYNCLNKLENAIKNRSIMVTSQRLSADSLIDLLNEYFITSQLITDIQNWRDKRNDVIHDLAKEAINYDDLKETSENGRDYFRRYTTLIMRLKNLVD